MRTEMVVVRTKARVSGQVRRRRGLPCPWTERRPVGEGTRLRGICDCNAGVAEPGGFTGTESRSIALKFAALCGVKPYKFKQKYVIVHAEFNQKADL